MSTPEQSQLSPEEKAQFSEIIASNYEVDPERQYEQDVDAKLDSLISILVGKKLINKFSESTAKNERDLEASIKMYRPDIPNEERRDLESQKMMMKLNVKPSDRGQESKIVSLFDSEQKPIGLLTMKHDHDGNLIYNASGESSYDWYDILDRAALTLMRHKSKS